MKMYMLIFLLIFFSLLGYVFVRGYQNFAQFPVLKITYIIVYVSLFLTMMTGFIGSDYFSPTMGSVVPFIGFTFLMVVIYMGIAFLVIDIFRIINHFFIHADVEKYRFGASAVSFGVVVILLIIGNYNFNNPVVTKWNVSAENQTQQKQLRIVMASDLHLNNSIGKKKLQQYVKLINEQNPDIVFFVGDIVDRNIDPFINQRMYEDLLQIKSTYGVFGATGNHEFYSSNKESNYEYYEKAGIRMLFDEAVLIDNSFYVLGRDDRMNLDRKKLSEIINDLDRNFPILLLDHQPFELEEAEKNGITMQFSGHTHNGQFFPGNIIVRFIYELAHGYKQKGNTHYFVSSGLGIWGPQYRIGTKSELVVVDLEL